MLGGISEIGEPMDLVFTAEHDALRAATRELLQRYAPEPAVRTTMQTEDGYDPALWQRMAGEIGLQGLIVPEAFGGSGADFIDLGVVMEELGRALYCGPFLSSAVLAATALTAADDETAAGTYLPQLCAGSLLATVADDRLLGGRGLALPTATPGAGTVRITGRAGFVLDGHIADIIVVSARHGDETGLYLVDTRAAGITATPRPTMDLTRKIAAVAFRDTPAQRLGEPGNAHCVLTRVGDLATIALAAEQAGSAQQVLDITVEYARTRTQFGRTIGSFQAVKHRCADMSVDVESARSAAYNGIWTAASEPDDTRLGIAASIAHCYCSEVFTRAAASCIQVHGGIGFTWEHSAHLYYRRAKSAELLFGHPAQHRRRLATLLGLAAA
jgi:alkylation response protein AidB-like acyl-CoA dehydrogenase